MPRHEGLVACLKGGGKEILFSATINAFRMNQTRAVTHAPGLFPKGRRLTRMGMTYEPKKGND